MTAQILFMRPYIQELINDMASGSQTAFYQLFHNYYLKEQFESEEKLQFLQQAKTNCESSQPNPALLAFYARILFTSKKKDTFSQALNLSEQAAGLGDANGLFNLGLIYQHGLGVEINQQTALNFFERAAEQKHPEALQQIAWLYAQDGKTAEAHHCYEQAAAFGLALSLNNQAFLYEKDGDFATAILLYEHAISRGQIEAIVNRARLHRAAGEHVQAIALYHRAVNSGDVIAMGILSEMYENGEGVSCDLARATQLYRQALLRAKREQDKKLIWQHLERLKTKSTELSVQYHASLALAKDTSFPAGLLNYLPQQVAELIILLLDDPLLAFREKQHYFNSILRQTKLTDLIILIQKAKPEIAKQAINLLGDYFLKRAQMIIGNTKLPEDIRIEDKICDELVRIPEDAICYREALQLLADTTYSMKLSETGSTRLAFRFARHYHDSILKIDLQSAQGTKLAPLIQEVIEKSDPSLLTPEFRTSWMTSRFDNLHLNDVQNHLLIYLERLERAKNEPAGKFFEGRTAAEMQPTTAEGMRLS